MCPAQGSRYSEEAYQYNIFSSHAQNHPNDKQVTTPLAQGSNSQINGDLSDAHDATEAQKSHKEDKSALNKLSLRPKSALIYTNNKIL